MSVYEATTQSEDTLWDSKTISNIPLRNISVTTHVFCFDSRKKNLTKNLAVFFYYNSILCGEHTLCMDGAGI